MALFATLIGLIQSLISLYVFVILIAVVMSWLIAFNVINLHHPLVRQIVRVVDGLTEPAFRPIRRIVPSFGGLDISPLIVLLILVTLNHFLKLQFGDLEFF